MSTVPLEWLPVKPKPVPVPPELRPQAGKVKPNLALKPDKLTKDCTPAEFRNWSARFEADYTSSNIDKATIEEQHKYIRACLDTTMDSLLLAHLDAAMPILGQGGCMEVLRREH